MLLNSFCHYNHKLTVIQHNFCDCYDFSKLDGHCPAILHVIVIMGSYFSVFIMLHLIMDYINVPINMLVATSLMLSNNLEPMQYDIHTLGFLCSEVQYV